MKARVTRTVFFLLVRTAKNIPPQNAHAYIYSFFTRKLGTLDFFATGKIADTEVNAEKTVQYMHVSMYYNYTESTK
jgi:hypothetical protein